MNWMQQAKQRIERERQSETRRVLEVSVKAHKRIEHDDQSEETSRLESTPATPASLDHYHDFLSDVPVEADPTAIPNVVSALDELESMYPLDKKRQFLELWSTQWFPRAFTLKLIDFTQEAEIDLCKMPDGSEQSAENGVRQLLDELIESPIDGYTVKRLPSDVYEVLRPGETSHAPVYGNKEVASAGQSVSGQNGHKI